MGTFRIRSRARRVGGVSPMRLENYEWAILGVCFLAFLCFVAAWVGIIWVVVHFIRMYW